MTGKFGAWLWPDHVIYKRESRRLREAHNTLYNSHVELLTVCQRVLRGVAWSIPADRMEHTEVIAELRRGIYKTLEGTP